MRNLCLALLAMVFLPVSSLQVSAKELDMKAIVEKHIIPGYEKLVEQSINLARVAEASCGTDQEAIKKAYNEAFDAWVKVSHLRFGPAEKNDRAYALAYWPDTKGFTPKTLSSLLRANDPAIHDLAQFEAVSIAARGFYALEFLLYDPKFTKKPDPNLCALISVVTKDMVDNSRAILNDWTSGYADILIKADNDIYRTHQEALSQLYTSLTTGLQFTADTRIGRPMGSFEKPRPNRAEARRSGRSLRHVLLSLEATKELAMMMSDQDEDIEAGFDRAIRFAEELDDPSFAGVADIQGRFRVEALQSAITFTKDLLGEYLAPKLGITAGFNSLDGD